MPIQGKSTKENKVEKALSLSADLKGYLDLLQERVVVTDLQSNLVFVNKAARTDLGKDRNAIDPVYWHEHYQVREANTLKPLRPEKLPIAKVLASGRECKIALCLNFNQKEVFIKVHARPHKAIDGAMIGCIATYTDITKEIEQKQKIKENERQLRALLARERRAASKQLRQSEATYRGLVENMNEGLVLLNAEGNISFVNEQFCKLTGYKQRELVGANYTELLKISLPATTPGGYELPVIHSSGQTRWHRVSFAKHQAGKQQLAGLILIHSDITEERKFAEERERLLMTAEHTTDYVAIIRIDGTVQYVNPAGRKAVNAPLNLPAEKLVMTDYYTQESLDRLYSEGIPQAIKQGSWQGDMTVVGKNKKLIPVSQVIITKRNADGKVEYFASIGRDMSESRKLQREMAILARMPHEQPSPLMRLSSSGTITYANPASEILLENWKTTVGKKMPGAWQKIVTNTLRQSSYKEFEIKCGARIFELKLVPVPEYDYVNLIGLDITHRKNAEEQLINSERKYRAVVEDQTELISRYLANGTITFANSAYCRYFGHDPVDIVGKNLFDSVPKNVLGVFKERLASLNKEKPSITYSQEIPQLGKPSRWQMWTDRAIYNDEGKFLEYQSVAQDITALKVIEQELRVQEMYLRQVIDSIPSLVFVRDSEGRYKLINKAFAQFVQKDIKQIIGHKHSEAISDFPLSKELLLQDSYVIESNQEQFFPEEMITRPTNGEQYWFSSIKKPLPSPDGKTQVLGVSTDITQRKIIEQSLQMQLRLKEIISTIATRFINIPYHQIDDAIQESLKTLGEINNVDRVVINLISRKTLMPRYYWLKEANTENLAVMKMAHPFDAVSWEAAQIREHGYLYMKNSEQLPKDSYLNEFVKKTHIKSSILLPLQSKGDLIGFMALTSTQEVVSWGEDVIALLRITSQVISSALERKTTEALLNFTLQFENIITIISANFISISPKDIDAEISVSLKYVAEFLGVDQSYIFMANTAGRRFRLSHSWLDNNLQPDPEIVRMVEDKKHVWIYRQVKEHGLVSIESLDKLPEEASELKSLFTKGGIKSMIGVPIMSKNVFKGLLVMASFRQTRFWKDEALPLLKIFGQIVANALERKQQEEEIAETRELYRTLARNIPKAAVFLYDHDMRYRLVEGAELENQGYDKHSMEGRTIHQTLPPTSLKVLEPLYRDALQGKEHIMEREFNKKHYLINFLPVRNERNEIYAGMVMSLDISDLKEIQKQLEQHTLELTRSNEDLELFAYAASHDLQEPLRMVSSYVHLIQRKLDSQLDADTREFMNFAVDGVKRMQELINALLEYSRVDRKSDDFRTINMNKTVEFVKINLQRALAETGAIITHDNLPEIRADQPQIISLLQNLLENGIKFHGTETPRVHIGFTEDRDMYNFYVKDNGIGIDKKYFDRIFVIFQRLNSRSEYAGTGIGLAICKKIVERHGGKLWVESEPGAGTTFSFAIAKPQM